ncbi:PDR/VanB family oxidoreductase [Microbacterium sp. LRZ72]|uniref:PDR/VanB family oxidoreductase n=1 Tax=Microbacterium sp. LRZ72 TaxID=2942481 RepID=UPI0029BF5E95|nr:PDR/VanB family oxidoreductase [Microbacterium sp. LRZ72]MDX2377663.1 PDR/VanB family oxidoreductase [Microbacterium sp. LRZ72]
MSPLQLRVRDVSRPVPNVLVAELEAADGRMLPAWEPGAHVELDLGGPLLRHYSLCGDPVDQTVWRIAVLLRPDGTGGSRRVHEQFTPGHTVDCRAVRNRMPMTDVPRLLFLAGGIGITPILPMVRAAEARGIAWRLVYTGREEGTMFGLAELVDSFGDRVLPHFSGLSGRVDVERVLKEMPTVDAIVCCGPGSLMQSAREAADRRGIVCVTEAFDATAPPHEADVATDSGEEGTFVVTLAQDGRDVAVAPNQTVLSALEEAGVAVASSCREGYCGTCETVVVEGSVDHRDSVLTPEEHADTDLMMVCVSRCNGARLVLDL